MAGETKKITIKNKTKFFMIQVFLTKLSIKAEITYFGFE